MEEQKKRADMGRPRIYGKPMRFEMTWSKDLIDKIDARKGNQSRRAYIEHLLRSHPEMQERSEEKNAA